MSRTDRIAIANQKGGVGKTTTTINLIRSGTASLGLRVLAIDADPQGNLTKALAPEYQGVIERSLATVVGLTKNHSLLDVIVPTEWDGVDIVPGGGDELADAGQNLVVMKAGRESRIKRALTEIDGKYDLVVMDCPPSLDQLAINAFTAVDALVIVTEPGLFALDGLDRLLDTVDVVREYTNKDLFVAGAIINGYRYTRRMDRWCTDIRDALGSMDIPVLEPPIQDVTWIAEAQEAGLGLDQWPNPKATVLHEAYTAKLTAVLESIKKKSR
jgi:chromosome partitioning protein